MRMPQKQKVPIHNGISLLPPHRAGSDNFAGRIYLIVSSYAQNKAHREIKEKLGHLKSLCLPGHIIMTEIVLVECTLKIHLVHCYIVGQSQAESSSCAFIRYIGSKMLNLDPFPETRSLQEELLIWKW